MQSPFEFVLRLLREGRRRKIYTSAAAYVALSLVLIQLGEAVFRALLFPSWTIRLLTVFLILGFPVVLILAWLFDVGPQGLRRTDALEASGASGAPADLAPASIPPAAPSQVGFSPVQAPPAWGGSRQAGVAGPVAVRPAAPSPRPEPAATAPLPPPETMEPPDPERVRRATLAHVRHELRTPINAILGYSEMLLEDAEEAHDVEAAGDLRRIHQAGEELLALIDATLDPERVSKDSGRELESYGAQIRADLRNPVNAVIGYAEMLMEGGREALRPDLERIRASAQRLLELSSDIVQFATLAAAAGPVPSRMSEASALAEGVLAKMRPVAPGAEEERQGSLLVIDDNATNRELLSRQLARKGYLVATAASGPEGLRRLDEEEFDLVLLDILMPGMDGVEVLRRIKAQRREIPVIMISSLDEIEGAIRCMELGAADYLSKPFHPTLLDVRIGAVLGMRRLQEREAQYRQRLELADTLSRRLLLGTCPAGVVERVRTGDAALIESYAEATVLVCDLERVARGGARADAGERAARFERALSLLEQAARAQGLDTLLLQGAAAVLAGGIPTPVADHAERVGEAALAALAALRAEWGSEDVPIRFGLHSGAAVGGVMGAERLSYQLWGDAVDLARRLEAQAESGSIHVSPATHALLKDRFAFTSRGVLEVLGRGQMRTYVLHGRALQPAGE